MLKNPLKGRIIDEDVLKKNVAKEALSLLLLKKLHISFVESCTGGMVASEFIGTSGASGAIEQSFITYSNDAKQKMVGVSPDTLSKYGAISSETACEMAAGGAKVSGSDICISITGNAGPVAEEEKPVGLVYIGCFFDGNVMTYEFNFEGDRQEIREEATKAAFSVLVSTLK